MSSNFFRVCKNDTEYLVNKSGISMIAKSGGGVRLYLISDAGRGDYIELPLDQYDALRDDLLGTSPLSSPAPRHLTKMVGGKEVRIYSDKEVEEHWLCGGRVKVTQHYASGNTMWSLIGNKERVKRYLSSTNMKDSHGLAALQLDPDVTIVVELLPLPVADNDVKGAGV